MNNNIERLNVNIQGQQKHHDEEIQTMKDRMELEKEKIVLNLQRSHQEEIQKLHEEYNAKVKSFLDEIESSKKPIKKNARKKKEETEK